jgi:LPS-assembly protein
LKTTISHLTFIFAFLFCPLVFAVKLDLINKDNYIFKPKLLGCFPDPISKPVSLTGETIKTKALADKLFQNDKYNFHLKGNVSLQNSKIFLKADEMEINSLLKTAHTFGNVKIYTKEFVILANSAIFDQKKSTVTIQSPVYQLTEAQSHGTGKDFFLDNQNKLSTIANATFSSCRIKQPNKNFDSNQLTANQVDWMLNVNLITLDNAKKTISGKHAILYFHSIPVLYTPYISFSTEQRKSGLLFPSFGIIKSITQNRSEKHSSFPVYFNLAPEFDNTLTFTDMEYRGILLGNEFRYLKKNHSATFTNHFIEDSVAKRGYNPNNLNIKPIKQRWNMAIKSQQRWGKNVSSDFDWRRISDKYLYADLPITSFLNTNSFISRHANINYADNNINANITVLDYLRLQNNPNINYTKRPEVGIDFFHAFDNQYLQHFSFNLMTEATEFEISESVHTRPEALRTVLSPSLQYNVIKTYGNFKTEVITHKIHYFMQDNGFNNTGATEHDITVPQFVLNGGLIFTRDFKIASNNFSQTLEPQIQYLYTPYQDQANIPIFDTNETSLNFSNLFVYNRFSGFDRIADSKQISMALTSKILNQTGRDIAEIGIGQIFFLADKKVQLIGNQINTDNVSDYFIELGFNTKAFSLNTTTQFSKKNYELSNSNSRLKIDIDQKFLFLLTSTITDYNQATKTEEISAGFNWQINNNWTAGSYINYDFTTNRKERNIVSVRYDSCCWATEVSAKETRLDNGLFNYSYNFMIELKGLSSTGTSFQQYLTEQLNF